MVSGQQRLWVNLVSLMVTLREEGRLPLRTIQWYLKTVHQLDLSVGAIVQAIQGVARQAQPAVGAILEQVRSSPVVQADETGWRQDGTNGYVWTFSTPRERYFLRRGRDKGVVDEVLDPSFSGVLVSDFYAAYNHYPGLKQRCWAHLLRDIHHLKQLYSEDGWAGPVGRGGAPGLHSGPGLGPSPSPAGPSHPVVAGGEITGPGSPFPSRPLGGSGQALPAHRTVHQGAVCLRVGSGRAPGQQRRRAEPPASGHQSQDQRWRSLPTRHRQQDGPASLFGTWRARGFNPLLECRRLLTSPQL